MFEWEARLEHYRDKNLFRQRLPRENAQGLVLRYAEQNYINFCSNDYLGLANHPKLTSAFKKAIDLYGIGSGASNLITGYTQAHRDLETHFAEFLGYERCLLFSNGYMANLGIITAVCDKRSVVFADKLNHASLIDAVKLSEAESCRYAHLDTLHLESLLRKNPGPKKLIVSEGVFSMEGSRADLKTLQNLAATHHALLMIDDAHGIGVLGKNGGGSIEESAIKPDILVCPLGKAFGGIGAIVAGSDALIESLIQFARPYIYTTSLSPAMAYTMKESLKIIREESWRREKLLANIVYFKAQSLGRNLNLLPSDTAIQSLVLGEPEAAVSLSQTLKMSGFLVPAIRYPTVPKHTARLRITLSALHEPVHIESLLEHLERCHEHLLTD